ncbi:MAG: flippase-like domain-containing protein [Caldilineales bacterium]|nr:flippase-like domain-containing protein [Caldilineales bacterium]
MRRHIVTILRIAISVALIALVLYLYRAHLPAVAASLTSANLALVVLAILIFWLAMGINGVKWWVLLQAQTESAPLSAILNFTFVGFFFNNLLPANIGGDVMRGYGLARYTDQSAEAAASVVMDRIIGLAAYMSVATVAALVTVFVTGRSDLQILVVMAVGASMVLAALGAMLLSRRVRSLIDRLVNGTFLRRLAPMWESLSQAFESYRTHGKTLLLAFAVGMGGIAATSLVNYVLSLSLGGGIPFLHILLFTPLIAMVLIIPISIGGLGLSQGVYPAFYGLVGVNPAFAFSLSVLMSAVQLFCSLPGGVLWLRWRRRPNDDTANVTPSHA